MLRSKRHIIFTWIVLLFTLPGLWGMATITHYCNACDGVSSDIIQYITGNCSQSQSCRCITTECSLSNPSGVSTNSEKGHCQTELAEVKPVLSHVQTEELLPLLSELDLLPFYSIVFSALRKQSTQKQFSYCQKTPHSSFSTSQGALRQSVFGTFLL